MNPKGRVTGIHNEHAVVFYGLSTCIWCRRTRQHLQALGVSFDYYYVDLLQGAERERIVEEVRRWNPGVSFPTLVIDDRTAIVGFRPEEIREALGL